MKTRDITHKFCIVCGRRVEEAWNTRGYWQLRHVSVMEKHPAVIRLSEPVLRRTTQDP